MALVEVFADITCPFTHVGLRRLVAARDARGAHDHRILVSSWPLELVNGRPTDGAALAPKVEALRRSVAPDLFAGFDPGRFPASSLPALGLVAAAYGRDLAAGERLSLAVRTALFEQGADVADPDVLIALARGCDLPDLPGDEQRVIDDWHRGEALGVVGSPHFFVGDRDVFCPTLEISQGDDGPAIAFDTEALDRFLDAAFG